MSIGEDVDSKLEEDSGGSQYVVRESPLVTHLRRESARGDGVVFGRHTSDERVLQRMDWLLVLVPVPVRQNDAKETQIHRTLPASCHSRSARLGLPAIRVLLVESIVDPVEIFATLNLVIPSPSCLGASRATVRNSILAAGGILNVNHVDVRIL